MMGMEYLNVSVIGLAFVLGLWHALDADHVMAITGMAGARGRFDTTARFARHWALGHGGTLLMIGVVVYGLGMAMPQQLSRGAEIMVALLLFVLSTLLVWRTARSNNTYHAAKHNTQRGAVTMGVLHGLAGSAPLLALLPLASMHSLGAVLAYLMIFSLGVVCAMLLFGGACSALFRYVQQRHHAWERKLRYLLAAGALLTGIHLLLETL